MNQNPYQPPAAGYDPLAPRGGGGGDAEVPEEILEAMRQTRPWVAFLAVLGFICVGLMALLGFGVMAMGDRLKMPGGGYLGLFYLFFGGFYIVPSLLMWRYGARIKTLLQVPSMDALRDAIVQQKSFWRFIGILTAVLMGLYVLGIVGGVVVGIASAVGKH